MDISTNLTGPYTSINGLIRRRFGASSLPLLRSTLARSSQAGGNLSSYRGRGMEFAEVRLYTNGDDVRTIDWRVTARKGKLHTKVFQEERERPVLILVDQTATMFFGSKSRFKSVAAADVAALIAWLSLRKGDRIGGVVVGNQECKAIRQKNSKKNVLQLLSLINDFNNRLKKPQKQAGDLELSDGFVQLRQVQCSGGKIFIISDFRNLVDNKERRKIEEQLHSIRHQNSVTMIMIFDPLEKTLPQKGFYQVSDGLSRITVNTKSYRTQQGYKNIFTQRCKILQDLCTQQQSPLLFLATTEDTTDVLLQSMSKII